MVIRFAGLSACADLIRILVWLRLFRSCPSIAIGRLIGSRITVGARDGDRPLDSGSEWPGMTITFCDQSRI